MFIHFIISIPFWFDSKYSVILYDSWHFLKVFMQSGICLLIHLLVHSTAIPTQAKTERERYSSKYLVPYWDIIISSVPLRAFSVWVKEKFTFRFMILYDGEVQGKQFSQMLWLHYLHSDLISCGIDTFQTRSSVARSFPSLKP